MKKTLYKLLSILIIAGSFGCSTPDTENKVLTNEEEAKKEQNPIIVENPEKTETQDTIGVKSEVKALGNEVDSLLKDI